MVRIPTLLALAFVALSACTMPRGGNISVRKQIINLSKRYIGVPYVYGGKTPRGFDCSGLTRWVYGRAARLRIPAGAIHQSRYGHKKRIPTPGDLMFFVTEGQRISHVAIYVGNGRFVHAPGRGKRVRVDTIRNRYWRKAYRFSRSYLRR